MPYHQRLDFTDPGREEVALLARFPSTGWRERERLKEISSWLEMGGFEQIATHLESSGSPQVDRPTLAAPFGRMMLIASTILVAGLLVQAARGLG